MPICSSATSYVYPDKYLSVDKPGVSITIYSIVAFSIQITVCGWLTSSLFVIHRTALLQCVLQRWHVDESWHMAADGCSRVHFLWANPQLPNRCCLRSGSASWWDIQEFIRIRIIEKKSCSLMWHDRVVEKSTDGIVDESSTILSCSLLVICQEDRNGLFLLSHLANMISWMQDICCVRQINLHILGVCIDVVYNPIGWSLWYMMWYNWCTSPLCRKMGGHWKQLLKYYTNWKAAAFFYVINKHSLHVFCLVADVALGLCEGNVYYTIIKQASLLM